MLENNSHSLVSLGAGIAIGALGIYALVELFPLLVLGGAGYLVIQGMKSTQEKGTETTNETLDS